MGGTMPSPVVVSELQRYIDGELTIAELAKLPIVHPSDSPVTEAVIRRHQLANYDPYHGSASHAA
jgi:hypothetical protein